MIKYIVHFFRLFVGSLFIFSGLIKINDPIGFSFKLEEYFGPTVFNIDFLIPIALPMAIFIVIFEVVLGIFLLLGFKKKFTLWSLLLMIVFFTFLTWYSAYFNKVTDCGCFGDAIKLTPWESFFKDIILLIMILVLFFQQNYILPLLKSKTNIYISSVSIFICLIIVYNVLNHLPYVDFRAYKIGTNIIEARKDCSQLGLPCDKYSQIMKVKRLDNAEIIEISEQEYVNNFQLYEWLENIGDPVLIQKGYEPSIYDFTIEKNGIDYTNEILSEKKLLIFVSYDLNKISNKAHRQWQITAKSAHENGYKVIGLTSSSDEIITGFTTKNNISFDFYNCDETALKTTIRSNPGLLQLKNGIVISKKHYNDFSQLNFE